MNTSNFIYPKELSELLASNDPPFLLDVREVSEYQFCALPHATLIPLAELPSRWREIPRDRDVVVYCRSGARSGNAAEYLLRLGYTRVKNLEGGILQWSDDVDPSVPRY